MKLNCGKTSAEKSQEQWSAKRHKAHALMVWHPYFCWWPTRITDDGRDTRDCRWLENIERRGTEHYAEMLGGGCWWTWEFRPLQKQ